VLNCWIGQLAKKFREAVWFESLSVYTKSNHWILLVHFSKISFNIFPIYPWLLQVVFSLPICQLYFSVSFHSLRECYMPRYAVINHTGKQISCRVWSSSSRSDRKKRNSRRMCAEYDAGALLYLKESRTLTSGSRFEFLRGVTPCTLVERCKYFEVFPSSIYRAKD
jgi:hypothetical protein